MAEQLVPPQTRRAIGRIVERPKDYSVEPDKVLVEFDPTDLPGPNGTRVSYLVSPEDLAVRGIVPQLGSQVEATVPEVFDDYDTQPTDFAAVPDSVAAEA